ncbi:MAG: DUF2809 domain-containing protein [Leptospirales bacterium]|nr:DUF2809 domain-containing protein [Leptospirales bacterium]
MSGNSGSAFWSSIFYTRWLVYLLISLFVLGLCITIVLLFSKQPFVRGFVGDTLIVVLLYCLAKTLCDVSSWKLAMAVLIFSFTIEGIQFLRLAELLGISKEPLVRLTIGAYFDPLDLLAYLLGTASIYLVDLSLILPLQQRAQSSRENPPPQP